MMEAMDRSGNQSSSLERQELSAGIQSYTPLQMHFLRELQHVVRQREARKAEVNKSGDWLLRVCNRTIYATYRDCIREGVGEEARAILYGDSQGWEGGSFGHS